MFDRLKSLPLTIALTLLIWLYAESQVRTAPELVTIDVLDVPVLPVGHPDVVGSYDVIVDPKTVNIKISGVQAKLDGLDKGSIAAYLDLEAADRAMAGATTYRSLRFTAPEISETVNSGPRVASTR